MDASHDTDARLGALLDEYQRLKDLDPALSFERMRDEAGELYPDFLELAECLDLVMDEPTAAQPPESLTEPPARARWVLPSVVAGLLLVAAGVVWFASRPGPARLDLTVHPEAKVRVDGIAYEGGLLAPGPHEIVVERKGFTRHVETLVLDGEDRSHTIHLVPLDPFDDKLVRALARSYGVIEKASSARLPRPVGIDANVDVDAALRVRDPDALGLELTRFPAAIRRRVDVRFLAARRLFRSGQFAASYQAMRELAERHPKRPEPWFHCARALWGLGLVESGLYREVLERYDGASPPEK